MKLKKKILIISGGSGSEFLFKIFSDYKKILEINSLINLYDNGKSSGELRKFLNYKILGPSDLRKIHSLSYKYFSNKTNLDFFNKRLSTKSFNNNISSLTKLEELLILNKVNISDYPIKLKKYIFLAFKLFVFNKKNFKSNDFSIANLVYAYLAIKFKTYNSSEKKVRELLKIKTEVFFNDCENLYLFALTKKGKIITGEEQIVNYNKKDKIVDIFFNKTNLTNKNIIQINGINTLNAKIEYLKKKYYLKPKLDIRSKKNIKKSEYIFFAPGTQFSSLFPTYMTKGFLQNINPKAKKILIVNIQNDNDTMGYKLSDYFDRISFFLSFKNEYKFNIFNFFDYILINKSKNKKMIKIDIDTNLKCKSKFIIKNFEIKNSSGIHNYNVVRKLIEKILKNVI